MQNAFIFVNPIIKTVTALQTCQMFYQFATSGSDCAVVKPCPPSVCNCLIILKMT